MMSTCGESWQKSALFECFQLTTVQTLTDYYSCTSNVPPRHTEYGCASYNEITYVSIPMYCTINQFVKKKTKTDYTVYTHTVHTHEEYLHSASIKLIVSQRCG